VGWVAKLFGARSPKPRIVVEQRAWVMAYDAPSNDPAWRREDTEREGDDFVVQVMKLVRTDDRLVLMAKDYTGNVDDTLDALRTKDWNAQYAQIFDAVTSVRVSDAEQTLMDRVVPALDVVAEGTTADGAQRIRERYAFVPGHQLIITAAGTVAAHERFAADVDRWFAGIAFRPR
jgi:hypothetical protein